jgi:transposase-like protein
MSTVANKQSVRGVRYTDAQKKEVIDFVANFNAENGRGGQSKAAEKFNISQITVAAWLKTSGAPAKLKKGVVAKKTKAPKTAKATKPSSSAKKSDAGIGVRYSPEKKKEVVDFVSQYNKENGRGGQSRAAEKFGVSALTVMAWLKANGSPKLGKKIKSGKATTAPKVAPVATTAKAPAPSKGSITAKLEALGALNHKIVKAELELTALRAQFTSLKSSL